MSFDEAIHRLEFAQICTDSRSVELQSYDQDSGVDVC